MHIFNYYKQNLTLQHVFLDVKLRYQLLTSPNTIKYCSFTSSMLMARRWPNYVKIFSPEQKVYDMH
jgi:hypothetical protein